MKWFSVAMILLVMTGPLPTLADPAPEGANSTSLLVVYGEAWLPGGYWQQPTGSVIWIMNNRTGRTIPTEVGTTQAGIYEAVFFDSDIAVADAGDTLIFLVSGGGFEAGNGLHVLSSAEISAGKVRYDVIPDQVSGAPLQAPMTVLRTPYPNPFNPQVTIGFELATGGMTRLTIHDLQGKLVANLVDSSLGPGTHDVTWYGLDHAGLPVASGVYLVNLKYQREEHIRKISLVR